MVRGCCWVLAMLPDICRAPNMHSSVRCSVELDCDPGTARQLSCQPHTQHLPAPNMPFTQGQVLFLAADTPLPTGPSTQLGGSILAVRLADELCGRVRVGDRVLAIGCGRYHGGAAAAWAPDSHLPLTLGVQVGAGLAGCWGSMRLAV